MSQCRSDTFGVWSGGEESPLARGWPAQSGSAHGAPPRLSAAAISAPPCAWMPRPPPALALPRTLLWHERPCRCLWLPPPLSAIPALSLPARRQHALLCAAVVRLHSDLEGHNSSSSVGNAAALLYALTASTASEACTATSVFWPEMGVLTCSSLHPDERLSRSASHSLSLLPAGKPGSRLAHTMCFATY